MASRHLQRVFHQTLKVRFGHITEIATFPLNVCYGAQETFDGCQIRPNPEIRIHRKMPEFLPFSRCGAAATIVQWLPLISRYLSMPHQP